MIWLTRSRLPLASLALLAQLPALAEPNLARVLHENVLTLNTSAHAVGDTLRGYTFSKIEPGSSYYWSKPFSKGSYRRTSGTGKEARITAEKYELEFVATAAANLRPDLNYHYSELLPYDNGAFPGADALLKDNRQLQLPSDPAIAIEKVHVGDKGLALKLDHRKYRAYFVRGPVLFQLDCEVRGPTKELIAGDSSIVPEDKANLLAEIENAHQQAYAAMIDEARQTAEIFDAWYRRRLTLAFPGPGIKGLYPLWSNGGQGNPFLSNLLKAADAPPDMPVLVTDFAKDGRGGTGALGPAVAEFRRKPTLTRSDDANNLEAYRISVSSIFNIGYPMGLSNLKEVWDAPIACVDEAKQTFQGSLKHLDDGAAFYRGTYFSQRVAREKGVLSSLGLDRDPTVDRVALSLAGADEAAKGLTYWHDTPTYEVVARRGNLIIVVSGRDSLNNAMAECERLAQLFLNRIATLKPPPAPAADDPDELRFYRVSLTAAPDRVWPEETSQLRLQVRDESGGPAANVVFKLFVDSKPITELRTDASGIAAYTVTAVGVNANKIGRAHV
jgi:hypothetical protein